MVEFNVDVILPSAGCGERIGIKDAKQYCPVLGKPLLLYALEKFYKITWVKNIVLVVDNIERCQRIIDNFKLNSKKVHLVLGQNTRHRSLYNGIKTLKKLGDYSKIVIVHDAVRPLVTKKFLQELVLLADEYGAAGSIRPLVSTILKPDDNLFIEKSLIRSQYVASETPQAFNFKILDESYSKCQKYDLDNGTECLELVLKYTGVKAKFLKGPDDLWKVTYKKDLYSALGVLKEKNNKVAIIASEENDIIKMIIDNLEYKVHKIEYFSTITESISFENVYNNLIIFHLYEIDPNNKLLNFESILDQKKEGTIIHVIMKSKLEDLKSISMSNIYENGLNNTKQYKELLKGVIIIHCFSDDINRLSNLISSIILSDTNCFSGQTFFL